MIKVCKYNHCHIELAKFTYLSKLYVTALNKKKTVFGRGKMVQGVNNKINNCFIVNPLCSSNAQLQIYWASCMSQAQMDVKITVSLHGQWWVLSLTDEVSVLDIRLWFATERVALLCQWSLAGWIPAWIGK